MGPVGAILAAELADAGAYVIPCDIIPERIKEIKQYGIKLTNVIKKNVKVPNACTSIKKLEKQDLDLAVIASKTSSLDIVIEQLSEIVTNKIYIMCAQNGIDNELVVAEKFGKDKTLRMIVNYAGGMSAHNAVHVAFFNPPNYIAPLSPKGEPIAQKVVDLLNSVGMETKIPERIQDYIWEKAILNSALSGVCAITQRTMKNVMDFPETEEIVAALIKESVSVAKKVGIKLDDNFIDFGIKYLKNAGHHRPSMAMDLENRNPTEIDRLNGRIVYYGKKHNMPTPFNQFVTALIRLLESPAVKAD
jgi:2-dehydropantoate 2-reductase